MPRIIPAFAQYFDGEGTMLSGGKLRFTITGTSTDKDTFSDLAETVANTNPVILDSEGRAPDVFGTDAYRVTLYDSDDVQIDQFDPVPGGAVTTSALALYQATVTYGYKDLVLGADGLYYKSLQAANLGNTPTGGATSAYWENIDFFYKWNSTKAYVVGDVMLYTDGQLYICAIATTAGQTPVTHLTSWDAPSSDMGWRHITKAVLRESIVYNIWETMNTLGDVSGTTNIAWTLGSYVTATITGNTVFTFSNWFGETGDYAGGGVIELTNAGAYTVTFTGSEWSYGVAPSLTVSGKDVITIVSSDIGASLMLFAAGLDVQ